MAFTDHSRHFQDLLLMSPFQEPTEQTFC